MRNGRSQRVLVVFVMAVELIGFSVDADARNGPGDESSGDAGGGARRFLRGLPP